MRPTAAPTAARTGGPISGGSAHPVRPVLDHLHLLGRDPTAADHWLECHQELANRRLALNDLHDERQIATPARAGVAAEAPSTCSCVNGEVAHARFSLNPCCACSSRVNASDAGRELRRVCSEL